MVTYTVVVAFDNSDLKLIPYLTANLQFQQFYQRKDVLLVSVTRQCVGSPGPKKLFREWREKMATALAGRTADPQNPSGSPGGAKPVKQMVKDREDRGRLWVKDGKFVRPVNIHIGATDGTQTEVSGDELKEGMKVVMGESKGPELADGGEHKSVCSNNLPRGGGRGGR